MTESRRDAEREAVARALAQLHGDPPGRAMEEWGNRARVAIDALDAERARSPQSEDHKEDG